MTKEKITDEKIEEDDEEEIDDEETEDIGIIKKEASESDNESEKIESEDDEDGDKKKKEKIIDEKEDEKEDEDDEYKCMYKFTKKKTKTEDDLFDEEELKFDDDENIHDDIVEPDKRMTKKKLFHYELVKALSVRAKQLSMGAKPLIKNVAGLDPKEIAKLELKNGTLPFIIERVMPNGMKEHWKISELI
jgi:DNA-directed RNA polymerase subunit K/omega